MADDSIKIKNLSNGAEHTVSPALWESIKDDPIYELVEEPKAEKPAKKAPKKTVKSERKAPASAKTTKTK